MPHDTIKQERGRIAMRTLGPTSEPFVPTRGVAAEANGITGKMERCLSEQQRDRMNDDMRDELVRLLPRLRRFSYSLSRDRDRCNDLVQETCARALAKLDQWEPGTRFDSWLFRIAQNIWLDRMRAEKSHGHTVDIDTAFDIIDTDGRDVTESRLTLQEVSRGIEKLAADQQVLVALVCVDGMSYKEAAEVLGLPIGTVMSRLSRARLALHQAVFGDTSGDDGTKGSGWQRGRVIR